MQKRTARQLCPVPYVRGYARSRCAGPLRLKNRVGFCARLGALQCCGLVEVFDTSEFKNPLLACIGYVFLGGVAGGLSLLFFPHPLFFHPSRIPGLSVIVSPVLAGLGMWLRVCIWNGCRAIPLRYGNAPSAGCDLFAEVFWHCKTVRGLYNSSEF